eukprot:GHVR01138850.1.p1 GENE.GHVR01138850.1~~GHVR01138850.1.p1  ORF type:complete len:182 (-),score=40.78 GHVR01138850.1:153-698(-)
MLKYTNVTVHHVQPLSVIHQVGPLILTHILVNVLNALAIVNLLGHDILMATMLNGAAVMDASLLLIAGNETCPQPQTSEHLAAVEIMRLKHIIILQNKIELVKESLAQAQQDEIKKFVSGTAAEHSPIIPISAVLKYNIDVLCEYICTQVCIYTYIYTHIHIHTHTYTHIYVHIHIHLFYA